MAILAINAGSSSLKFAMHPVQGWDVLPCILSGTIEGLQPQGQPVMVWSENGQQHQRVLEAVPEDGNPFAAAFAHLQQRLTARTDLPALLAVAHRVVHGGAEFTQSVVVDEDGLQRLQALQSLAPLHQPHNLAGIRWAQSIWPQLPHVACFDTAFHASMPEVDYAFALPRRLQEQGVRRYGFHGLSYQFIAGQLQARSIRSRGRVVMAHLGNGASLCATLAGHSVSTTMGFSALDGLMMGTRSGSLDAGVLLFLLEQGWTRQQLEHLLYRQSGLLGVSGISADMRQLRADGSEAAQRAIDQFAHRVVRETGALAACLGGLDVLAFSGGIGEHDTQLRADVCERLAWLGVRIDAARNAQAVGDETMAVHAPDSTVEIWVVPTDEGRVAAQEAAALLRTQQARAAAALDMVLA